jgi:hypothetical protein
MVLSTGYSHRGEASAPRDDGVTSAYVGGFNPSASATLNAQFWFERFPWRPTAAWSAIAGLLALGYGASLADVWGSIDWRTLALVLLLADPLWGSIWRLASGRDELLPLRRQVMAQQFWLPYLTADSPAAHVMGRSGASASTVFPLVFRVALPTVLLACAVALVLGLSALWMTGAVVLCGVLGWMNRRLWRRQTHLLHAAVTVALPWGLALSQLGAVPRSVEVAWAWQWALLGLWTVHNWGEGRCLRASTDRWGWGLMAAAEIGIILLLVLARAPVLLAILVILGIPTWLSIYYGRPLQRVTFWWLISMLISALAVGQTMLVS